MKDNPIKSRSLIISNVVLVLVIFILSLFASRELFYTWLFRHAETKSWIYFLIWILPVIWYQAAAYRALKFPDMQVYALYFSIAFTLVGVLGSLNSLCYMGLAVFFLTFLPPRPIVFVWLIASVTWMPAMGWAARWYFSEYEFFIRFGVVIICSALAIYTLRKKNKGLEHE